MESTTARVAALAGFLLPEVAGRTDEQVCGGKWGVALVRTSQSSRVTTKSHMEKLCHPSPWTRQHAGMRSLYNEDALVSRLASNVRDEAASDQEPSRC